eukprot:6452445-Ditylum_brightwellii.AAC.1
MICQTIGFNCSPSGVSTNVWNGVMLCNLLFKAGVSEKNMSGKHVEFIGVKNLPFIDRYGQQDNYALSECMRQLGICPFYPHDKED